MVRGDKIIILGSNGMLGQMAERYFISQGYNVEVYNERFTYDTRIIYAEFLVSLRNAIVINCIGKIKQKTDDIEMLLEVNSVFPAFLREHLDPGVILIHPSTDCVFSGIKGSAYSLSEKPDAVDDYGWSKRLGEVVLDGRKNTLIPRVSIVGTDKNKSGKGLLSWLLSNSAGSQVNGYKDHIWNGITTLEWCKKVEEFLMEEKESFEFKLIQYGTREFYTKYSMLVVMNEYFNCGLSILKVDAPESVNRTMIPSIPSKPFEQQLLDLKNFWHG